MHSHSTSRWLMAVLGLMALGLLTGGVWFYQAHEHTMRSHAEAELTAIAQLKVDQIVQWRAERLGDASILTADPFLAQAVARWLAAPQAEVTSQLLSQFLSMQTHYHYYDVLLVDAEGQVRLSLSGFSGPLHEEALEALAAAWTKRQPVMSDLHIGPGDRVPHVDMVAPLFKDEATKPVGAVILQSDAQQFLYSLIQSWPTPSRTAEVLIVRRDGDDVLFLNDLRFQPNAALTFRIPLSQTAAPAVQAALGREGLVQGKDYRGVEVLAALKAVPDMDWSLVAKMDAEEALSAMRRESALVMAFLLGMALTIAGGGIAVWQFNVQAHYRALYRAEAARRKAEERHRVTLMSVGDAVITTDAQGRVEFLNPTAEALTGWKQGEARGRPLEEVFCILNEATRQPVESPVSRVWREGRVVGLANHTLLIARDGTERPIADSGAPIYDEQGQISGVVLVFRDQTAERAALRALQESESRFRRLFEHAPLAYQALDEEGNIQDVNPAWLELPGYEHKQIIGRQFGEFIAPEQREAFKERFARFRATGEVHGLEFEVLHQDGLRLTISFDGKIGYDEKGNFQQAHCLLSNITERRRLEEEVRQRLAQLEALRQVGLEVTTELDLDVLLRFIVERAVVLVGGHWGGFEIYRPELDALVYGAMWGAGPDLTGISLQRGEGLAGRVWESGQPLIVEDYHHWAGRVTVHEDLPTRALIGIPVQWRDEFLGVLMIGSQTVSAFTLADSELLNMFATQAAAAIHNARLYQKVAQAAERRVVLHRASQEIIRTLHDPEQVYQAVHWAAAALMPTDAFVIVLPGEAGQPNKAVYLFDRGEHWPPRYIPADQGLSGQVIASNRSLRIDDLTAKTLPQAIPFGSSQPVRSLLAVPLRLEEKAIGMISVQSYQPHAYTAEDQFLLEMLAAYTAAALETARLYEEAQRRNRELALLN
ncbi:MAG: PAS domain S-box protein, partial [Anaerolineae bacterium]